MVSNVEMGTQKRKKYDEVTREPFPFQYLAEKKLDSMLFKQELYVEKKTKKKRHNKSFKRHIMFYFPFCFLGLVFCPMFWRKETKTIKYRTEIKTKNRHFLSDI